MFTGIVQGLGVITAITEKDRFRTHHVRLPSAAAHHLAVGASVANNGCCLTITQVHRDEVAFDIMAETLDKTNLGALHTGDQVNIERAAHFGDEIGGHLMSGHIFTTIDITRIEDSPNNRTVWFQLPETVKPYVFTKGFVGLNGCSLTIGNVTNSAFNVHLIPETLQRTLFGQCRVGERVNLEIDPQTQAIVDTVQRVLNKN